MRDLERILERASASVDLGPDAFGKLQRRRDTKQRRQRITAVVVVALLLGGLLAAAWSAARQMEPQPGAPDITNTTVGSLQELWSYDTGGVAAPAVAGDGIVVTTTKAGQLLAFPGDCRTDGAACDPLWTAQVGRMATLTDPNGDIGVPIWPSTVGVTNGAELNGGAVISDGAVYAVNRQGTVYAFPADCSAPNGTCAPLWTAHVDGNSGMLPQEMDGTVYLATDRFVYAFRNCPKDGSSCRYAWRVPGDFNLRAQDGDIYETDRDTGLVSALDPANGDALWTGGPGAAATPGCCGNSPTAVRVDDTVYVSFGTELDAFPASCSGRCDPAWIGHIPDSFASGPVVAGGGVSLTVATDTSTGGILTFPVDCRSDGGVCTTSYRTSVDAELTTSLPVVAGNLLFAVSTRASGVFAFDTACLASQDNCAPVWTAFVLSPDQPIQVADTVFVADLGTGPLRAFPLGCVPQAPSGSTSQDACQPLWQSGFQPMAHPAVLDDRLFTTDVNGVLHASGLVAQSAGAGGGQGRSGAPIPLLVMIGLAIVLGVRALVRRRRGALL